MVISRDLLYKQFGPQLTEAIERVNIDEMNDIRSYVGMKAISKQHILNAVTTELAELTKYDWMDKPPL